MEESDHSSEIRDESPRSQSQPYHTPNSHVAAEQINPELLRAIVNGDLILFKRILGINEAAPIDIIVGGESNGGNSGRESNGGNRSRESNGGNGGLRGVTCGGNTALHVVVMGKSRSMVVIDSRISSWESANINVIILGFMGVVIIKMIILEITPIINLIILRTKSLRQIFLLLFHEIFHEIFHERRIQNSIAAAKRTWWYMWLSRPLPSDVGVHKMTTYEEIARIIYREDPTLLDRNNGTKETPLQCAVKAGKLEMVSLLINFARDEDPQKLKRALRARNEVKETALHEAACSGYSNIVRELLSADDYLTSLDFFSATSTISVENNGTSPVEELLLDENGGVVDENLASMVDENGISPLYLAVAAGCLDVVKQLIAPNREPSYAGPDEQTALHAAVMTQEENIMRVILEWKYGCEQGILEKTDKAGNTPLHYAALIGNTCAVRELLLKDTGPVYKDNLSGSFPVHLAAEGGNVEVIMELLRTCPDVGELLDNEKRNFLHIAVEKKKIGVIMLAYKGGINANVINAKDKDGNTPLHLAVINSESEIFVLLCQNKRVNLHIRNKKGLTPMDLSASLKDDQFTYTLNPQSIIHRALVSRGAFQNPCQRDQSKKVNNFSKARADRLNQREGKEMLNGVEVDIEVDIGKESKKYENMSKSLITGTVRLNRREGEEMLNGVEVDIEKESTKYENMSKSLTTGAALIASATFASIFIVSGVYRADNTPPTLTRRYFFKAFIIVNMAAFICAILSTISLLYSALSNFHLKYRKFYFKRGTSLLQEAINLFILTFGLGAYIAIAPLSEWPAIVILVVSGIVVLLNIIWSPKLVPLIYLVRYMSTEFQ